MDVGDDSGLLHWLFTGGLALLMLLFKRSIGQMDSALDSHGKQLMEHGQKHADCSLDLANFKTDVANTYAKDTSVQQSLSRIHERLDENNRTNEGHFKEIREDIKQILQRVK